MHTDAFTMHSMPVECFYSF